MTDKEELSRGEALARVAVLEAELAKTQQAAPDAPTPTFQLGDHVRKTKGSQWKGRIVGTYSTTLTPEGYAVESDTEKGSVQIYPAAALELSGEGAESDVAGMEAALRDIAGKHHHSASAGAYFAKVARKALAQQCKDGET